MAVQRRRARQEPKSDGLAKLLRFATIPIIVIILIIIILCLDTPEDNGEGDTSVLAVSDESEQSDDSSQGDIETLLENNMTESRAEENGEGSSETEDESLLTDPTPYPFQQDVMLELTGLVQAYCEAKTECDPELLAWVFGIEDWSEEEKNERKARMELVKASVKGYQNISCYSIQGPEEGSYVIFPYYEIRYRETETLMPAFSWGYALPDDTGRYYMVQEIGEEINEYIRKVGEKSEVKAVMSQILARQQEAMAADEVLQKIYGSTGESQVIIGGVGG